MPAERREGMDHAHYAWSPLPQRPPLRWPGGARLALAVIVVLEYLELDPPAAARTSANLSGGLGSRPHPNYALLSHREYGHRVGIFRVLDALERHGVTATVAMDALTAEAYPWLVQHCRDRGAEFVAHGISVSRMISSAMSEDEERAYIGESLDRIRAATGVKPLGWLGPEYGESERTPALLAEAGLRYVCDWLNDEQPYRMTVPGGDLYTLPGMLEYDDAFALWTRGVTLDTYGTMITDGFDRLHADGEQSGRLLALTLRPWLIGQPFRIGTLERALGYITARDGVWATSAGAIVEAYAASSS